jgi:hypothetical protein
VDHAAYRHRATLDRDASHRRMTFRIIQKLSQLAGLTACKTDDA